MSSNVNNVPESQFKPNGNKPSNGERPTLSQRFQGFLNNLPAEAREQFESFNKTLDSLQTALTQPTSAPKGCGCVGCGGGCACG